MAFRREVIFRSLKLGRWVLTALIVFLLNSSVGHAAAAAPYMEETDWRTGELLIKYSNVTPGYTLELYAATYHDPGVYKKIDSWTAPEGVGAHTTMFRENGQTIWYYLVQVNPETGERSPQSNLLKQTPPITAFIINWPDMLNDLNNMINNALNPSDKAMDDLKDAIDNLKDAVGAGQAAGAGSGMGDAISGAQNGMHQPIVNDDGNGTYTGGSTGGKLPYPNGGSGGLEFPNADSGTDTEMTMRIPYMVDMNGNLVYFKIFTKEQMEKMKWLGLLRTLAAATMWIIFGFWLVQRFTPQLKA